jgi:acyl carrier protein
MTFVELVGWLDERVGLPREGAISEDTELVSLDSLQRAELWIAAEELGLDLPEELFTSLRTWGDVYHYYCTRQAGTPAVG